MRKIMAFRDTNHTKLAEQINSWLAENQATAVSISVTYDSHGAYFHAFLIYEQ